MTLYDKSGNLSNILFNSYFIYIIAMSHTDEPILGSYLVECILGQHKLHDIALTKLVWRSQVFPPVGGKLDLMVFIVILHRAVNSEGLPLLPLSYLVLGDEVEALVRVTLSQVPRYIVMTFQRVVSIDGRGSVVTLILPQGNSTPLPSTNVMS